MTKLGKVTLAVIVACLWLAPGSEAKRPSLNMDRATRAATHYMDAFARGQNEDAADDLEEWKGEGSPELGSDEYPWDLIPFVTKYNGDRCDRASRTRAECDWTYWLDNGDICDAIVNVQTTRRNLLAVWDVTVCDSEITSWSKR